MLIFCARTASYGEYGILGLIRRPLLEYAGCGFTCVVLSVCCVVSEISSEASGVKISSPDVGCRSGMVSPYANSL